MPDVTIIGGGLAGSEAAWQAAERGCSVELWEMRPVKETPAHRTDRFAELVCSNSLGNLSLTTASGLLKEELRRLGSVILRCADANSVPAGGALGVAREDFARAVTEAVHAHPKVEVIRREATALPDGPTIVATGPLTSDALVEKIEALYGETLYFYDAASPIIHRESLDDSVIYRASRYGKGEAAYLNCPMTEEQYYAFVEDLATAELSPIKNFEEDMYFEGCLPVETIARRGPETLRFGPMKPVGLPDPPRPRRRAHYDAGWHDDGRPRPLHHHQGGDPPAHKLQLGPRPRRPQEAGGTPPRQAGAQATPGRDGARRAGGVRGCRSGRPAAGRGRLEGLARTASTKEKRELARLARERDRGDHDRSARPVPEPVRAAGHRGGSRLVWPGDRRSCLPPARR